MKRKTERNKKRNNQNPKESQVIKMFIETSFERLIVDYQMKTSETRIRWTHEKLREMKNKIEQS